MDNTLLSSINWQVLVVDEAHRLKNNQSKVRVDRRVGEWAGCNLVALVVVGVVMVGGTVVVGVARSMVGVVWDLSEC